MSEVKHQLSPLTKAAWLAAFLFLAMSLPLRADDDAKADEIFQRLLAAQLKKDYDAFIADGTDQIKAALSKTQFEAAANLVGARLKVGYDSTLLGELNQKGYTVYLYRLRFKDSGDDMLATLSLKDGKVGGIYFK